MKPFAGVTTLREKEESKKYKGATNPHLHPLHKATILDEEGVVIAAKDARNRANDDEDNGGVYVKVGQAIEEDQDEGLGLKYGHVYVIRTHLLFCTFIF